MKIQTRRLNAACVTGAVAALTALSGSTAVAAPLALSDEPLFLSTGVQPNLIMAIDDSGSMDFEVLLRGNDGSAWWRTGNASGSCTAATGRSFIGCIADGATDLPGTGLNFNNAGEANSTWKKYSYLFPNGSNSAADSYQRRAGDDDHAHYAIPPLPAFAWSRSPDYNAAYFNPANSYEPWPDGGSYTFADAPPTAARFDPVFGDATNTIDLTRDFAGTGSANITASCANSSLPGVADNYYFRMRIGMTIPEGTCIRSPTGNWEVVRSGECAVGVTNGCNTQEGATDLTYTLDNNTSLAIRYFPATFYLADAASLPSTFGYTGATIAGAAPDGTLLRGYEIKPGNFATPAQYAAAIQNFANWFTYTRKRHQALRAGLGEAFSDIAAMRVAGFTINNNTADVTMGSIDNATHRDDLYDDFYRDFVRSGGTPNRRAVYNIVRNFKRTGSSAPIQHACQKNFGMLFTDGFSNQPASGDGFYSLGNIDGTHGDPYSDSQSGTLADGVMDAYVNPLRTTPFEAEKVRVPAGCGSASPDPKLDCNRDLHMNFYAVTLGTRGLQFNPDAVPAQDPYATAPSWPTSFPARHPSAVDDIWHATVNGRGQLLNARSPDEISDKLSSVLTSIIESSGSASSASVNSGSISSETRVFQAKFDSADWTGQLLSYPVNEDGSLVTTGSKVWDASEEIPAAADREIITVNSDGSAVAFTWGALDPTRKEAIDPDYAASSADEARASARLDYLRGDATNEAPSGLGFRIRTSKLGDIIASSPMFVGAPRFGYRDSLEAKPYSAFKLAHTDDESTATNEGRRHVVYAGANDGMLHAFDAEDGEELFAFIPSPAFRNLRSLSDPAYTHKYFVDGAPNMGDAFINNDWATVLVGGLNRGGQGIYALDITDPSSFTETSAGSIVMWEFTDADDADLGYTYSQPAIVRLQNGRWGAIFGNGYNNTESDDFPSLTGNAVLYIVDLEDGSIIKKLDTGVGAADDPEGLNRPNGMSTPAVVDINGDAKVDFVYAGDLFGNLWKFDIRNPTAVTAWDFSFSDSSGPLPLFTAVDPVRSGIVQPITSRPEIIRGPRGVGMMALFGTGKYIETSDKVVDASDQRIQAYYGLFDRNSYTSGVQDSANRVTALTELVQQSILDELSVTFGTGADQLQHDVRVTSQLPLGGNKGWYLNLLSPDGYQGERQVSNTAVRAGRVIFTTLIPDEDPCESGGSSWLMELDALSGGRLEETPFDLNNDGVFDDKDFVEAPDGTMVAVSGLQPGVGITPEPGILIGDNGRKEFKYNPGTSGEIAVTVENPGKGASGRQSWRQIR